MNPTNTFDPPIEITSSEKVPQSTFNTPNELVSWVDTQREFYQKLLGNIAGSDPALNQVWGATNNLFNTFAQQINNANSNPKTGREVYENIFNQLLEHFTTGRLFESSSPFAQFLL